jgi:pseudouridine-5'-phosphate glycosidase
MVVCAGAKSILDLPQTLELLETLGVPVVGYQTSEFPAFYTRTSGLPINLRVETPAHAAALFAMHRQLHGGGVVLALPVAADVALDPQDIAAAVAHAEAEAHAKHITGQAVTPYLLRRLADLTNQRTLTANQALIVANARLAAEVACALAAGCESPQAVRTHGET